LIQNAKTVEPVITTVHRAQKLSVDVIIHSLENFVKPTPTLVTTTTQVKLSQSVKMVESVSINSLNFSCFSPLIVSATILHSLENFVKRSVIIVNTTKPAKKSQFARTVQHAALQARTFIADVQKRTPENSAKLRSTHALI
jgi:hypothetical protein